ncbi:MAG: CRISPR-associated endonuclease Cas2 [Patescibacteria group bacterium]|nr:CRISPR-associated endonuclease Cas2 [Patescibacteria group bacterium]
MKMRMRDRILWGLAIGGEIVEQIESGGSRASDSAKLFLWTPPGYARKKFRQLVARMVREGYVQQVLIEGRPHFRLTGMGRKQLMENKPVLKQLNQEWDGFWRIVIFDISESERKTRDILRRQLIKRGFELLQNSTYISCYDYSKDLLEFLDSKGLKGKVLLLESKQKYLGEPKLLAEKVWGLKAIEAKYKQVIDRVVTRFGIKEAGKREEFLKKIYRDYLETLLGDPMLPKSLLAADWSRGKAGKYLLRAGALRE